MCYLQSRHYSRQKFIIFFAYIINNMVFCSFSYLFLFQLIKYGVISTSILIDDLLNWNNLYIAGRLQKPVSVLLAATIRDISSLRTRSYFDL